jgi:hypothetical protein
MVEAPGFSTIIIADIFVISQGKSDLKAAFERTSSGVYSARKYVTLLQILVEKLPTIFCNSHKIDISFIGRARSSVETAFYRFICPESSGDNCMTVFLMLIF